MGRRDSQRTLFTGSSISAVAVVSALAALIGAVLVAWTSPGLTGGTDADPMHSVLVLEVDSEDGIYFNVPPGLLEQGQAGETIDWHFERIAPNPAALRRAIARWKPRVAIFLTEDLLAAIDDRPYDTAFLVASELAPDVVRRDYAKLRREHRMAVVTWHASVYGKLLDHVAALKGATPKTVVGFFQDSLVQGGVAAEFEAAAQARGIRWQMIRYSEYADLSRLLMETLGKTRPDGVVVPMSGKIIAHMTEIADLVADSGTIGVYSRRDQVVAGGLVATDAPGREVYDHLVRYAVLILHGANPSALEISQPTRFETIVNLKSAARIGKTVPYEMLVSANRIIE
jgi:hypothetical protein